jgi:hypothetical protein
MLYVEVKTLQNKRISHLPIPSSAVHLATSYTRVFVQIFSTVVLGRSRHLNTTSHNLEPQPSPLTLAVSPCRPSNPRGRARERYMVLTPITSSHPLKRTSTRLSSGP